MEWIVRYFRSPNQRLDFVRLFSVVLGCTLLSGCSRPPAHQAAATASAKFELPQKVLEQMASARQRDSSRGFDYPWSGLEQHLAQEAGQRLLLVGYGSLISLESAAETIRGVNEKEFFPVVALGAKRVFNYRIPEEVLKELGDTRPDEVAALNVIATGQAADLINGRIVPVSADDLPGLRDREFGYHLRPVTCVRWTALDSEPFTAYVLCAEDSVVKGRQVIDNTIKPHLGYVEICTTGAKAVSESFNEVFLDTSFLADGSTSLRQWLKSRPAPTVGR